MPTSYALYLDDVRHPPQTGEDWVLVRSVAAMRELLEVRGIPALASFDYELGRTDPSNDGGDAVASFLEFIQSVANAEEPVDVEVRLHTSSSYGATRMAELLRNSYNACGEAGIRLMHSY
ncbi:MAG: cyclic-phosphate processing receiver domain-containing protein [Opitutaceae bacterium]